MNPRRVPRRRRASARRKGAGPRNLKNLPKALKAYWMKRRGLVKRLTNPRRSTGASMAARPRRRRRAHHLTAHQRRSRAARKASRTRAKRYGRRTYFSRRRRATAADFGINPRRRRLSNPRRMKNPFAGFGSVRGVSKLATGAGIGALGAVGLDYLWQWGSGYLPASLQSGYLGTVAKAGAAVLGGWAASKVIGKPIAAAASGGALIVVAYQLLHQLIAQHSPAASIPSTTTTATPALGGMGAYMPGRGMGSLAWTSPGSQLRGLARTGAYMAPRGAAMNRPGGGVNASGLASAGTY